MTVWSEEEEDTSTTKVDPVPEPIVTKVTEETPVVTLGSGFRDNVNNTKHTPVANLVKFASGSSWTVNYYRQLLGEHQEPKAQDLNSLAPSQQYTLIRNLELKVLATDDPSQDTQTREWTSTGTAQIYAKFIPNKGDMFIADNGDGELVVIEVTTAKRTTLHKSSVSEITYGIVDYLTPERIADFEAKVVKTLIFDRTRTTTVSNGLLSEEEHVLVSNAKDLAMSTLEVYLSEFYCYEDRTLMLKDESKQLHIYDGEVIRIIKALLDDVGGFTPPDIKYYTQRIRDVKTIFSLLYGKFKMRNVITQMELRDVSSYIRTAKTHTVGITRASKAVHHREAQVNQDYLVERTGELPDFIEPHVDGMYILSSNFYAEEQPRSVVEQQMAKFYNDDDIDISILTQLLTALEDESKSARFFYTPLVIGMLVGCLRGK